LAVPVFVPAVHGEDSSGSEAQIRSASRGYLEALIGGDAKRVAAFWTPQGTYVDSSNQSHPAQQLIQEEFVDNADSREPIDLRSHHSEVRLLAPNVAMEKGNSGEHQDDANTGSETTFIAIWVKSGERWLLDYLQEFEVSPKSAEGPLAELSWMVGEWVSHADGVEARLTVTWSNQRNFLLQKFTVLLPDRNELRGEQRIAWDASKKQIRSWLFRSDGGFAEGAWTLEGNTWVVKKSEVAPTGEKIATVNLWVHEDSDSCWFKSLNAGDENKAVKDLVLQFRRAD
jgi:ketosteroid isomerase-like protein